MSVVSLVFPPSRHDSTLPVAARLWRLSEIAAHSGEITQLAEDALVPNVSYFPHVLAAQAAAFTLPLQALALYQDSRLIGVLPFLPRPTFLGLRRINAAFLTPFITSCLPLMAREQARTAADGFAAAFADIASDGLFLFPSLPLGPVADLLQEACAAQGLGWHVLSSFERAVLSRSSVPRDFETYLARQISPKRRRELRRSRKRLSEKGHLVSEIITDPARLPEAVEAFLTLERQGWKGQAGTAMGLNPALTKLAHDLFSGVAGGPQVRADLMRLDGVPIAVSLALIAGGRAVFLKTTYDERLRQQAPGLLLEEDMLAAFFKTGFADVLDSASQAGCVVEELWSGRETIADVVVYDPKCVSSKRFERLIAQEQARQALFERLKQLYHRYRHWRGTFLTA